MDRLDEALLADARTPRRTARRLSVGLATDEEERRAAQRLRWRVFAEELGARLDSPEPGIDQDIFDAYCEHLVVKDGAEVVGTYRSGAVIALLWAGVARYVLAHGYTHLAGCASISVAQAAGVAAQLKKHLA